MINIKIKYIILFWIIILILFTFYCIIKLNYLREKYIDTSITKNENIIDYINNIEKMNKITDVSFPKQCSNLYDDNIKVQSMGYNNCESAYSDYLSKGFNVNNKFGQSKSLGEICPISSKSVIYTQCLTSLLKKFTDNANVVDSINIDMSSSINKRLQDRSNILYNIQNQMNSLVNNNDQNEFKNYLKENNYSEKYKEDSLELTKNYYQNRYSGIESFDNINSQINIIIDPEIENMFFGVYKPISGQFLAFDDLTITLSYDILNPTTTNPTTTNPTITNINVNEISSISPKPIIIKISSITNDLDIVYNIINISKYKAMNNSIKLSISYKNVVNNKNISSNSQTIQQLLNTLGFFAPTQLVLSYEEYTSTENVLHKTYKLVNDNLDTILILNKV